MRPSVVFVFVESIVGFGVFDLGGFLQLIDQFLQLGILSLRDQFRLDLRTNLLERLGLADFGARSPWARWKPCGVQNTGLTSPVFIENATTSNSSINSPRLK